MMDEETEQMMERPNDLKLIEFDNIVEYLIKIRQYLSFNVLKKHGFNDLEIRWLNEHRQEQIEQVNGRMETKRLQRMREENRELKEQVRYLEKRIQEYEQAKNEVNDYKTYLERDGDIWRIYRYSETMGKKCDIHTISNENVQDLFKILSFLAIGHNKAFTYKQIINGIIIQNKLDIGPDEINGGKNRGKYYFPLYYYPMKVLEHLGYVKRLSKGERRLTQMRDIPKELE